MNLTKVYHITVGHYNAALEHIDNNSKFTHTPTYFQALRMTMYDLVFNKIMYDSFSKSYVVYEVVTVPTLGLRVANVIRLYAPKPHRGKGIISNLLDRIPEDTTISTRGDYGEVGRLYISRTIL